MKSELNLSTKMRINQQFYNKSTHVIPKYSRKKLDKDLL